MIDWNTFTFAALEGRRQADNTVVLFGHTDAACADIVTDRVAPNTSLVDYLTARNRPTGGLTPPIPCPRCVDEIEAQLSLLDKLTEPTPVQPVVSPEAIFAAPPPLPPATADDSARALNYLRTVDDATLAKFEFLQAMRQKLADDPSWIPSAGQTTAILKFDRPKKPAGPQIDLMNLPAGKYAVGTVIFRVDRPTDAKWGGWVFVKQQVPNADGGHDWERIATQKPGEAFCSTKKGDFLAKILADPIAAKVAADQLEKLLKGVTA